MTASIQYSKTIPVREDVDVFVAGGGPAGIAAALVAARQGKKVFILRETYDNRTFLWPRKFKDPVVVNLSRNSGSIVRRSLQIGRTFGRKASSDIQPSLF